ncbi:hypothetical protein KAR34_05680 [bacterium]|nr:hypothetical protein [bacterium]
MGCYKKTSNIFRFSIFTVLLAVLGSGLIVSSYAETPLADNSSSQVRIAWDEFKKMLKIETDEIKLSWDEFKKLLAQTGSEVKVEYNIQDGMVVLARAQFKQLLDKMKPLAVTAIQPPRDYLITKAGYTGKMSKESTTFTARLYLEIFKQERKNYSKIPLLPQDIALRKIKLDNASALVMNESGWYVLTTDKIGQHVVDLEFSVKSNIAKGPEVLNFKIPQTAITLLRLDIPLKRVKVEIPQAKHMVISRSANRTQIESVLSTTNHIEVKLHRALVVKKKRGPAKIYAETMNLLSIEDDALRVSTKLKLNILQNAVSQIELFVPAGYSVLYVKDQNWQEIRDWSTRKVKQREVLTLPFAGEKEGTVIVTIVSEKIFSDTTSELEFDGFQVLKAIRETGYIGAEKKSTAEAEIIKVDNTDRVDIQELPYDLVDMSAKPLIFGLRYLRHPFHLKLKITKHEELPTVNTVIDNASVMSVLLEEGKVITRVIYTIRNTWKQFLELKLPEDAEIWSLYVNGKRELPARNKEGKFMLPLVRSKIEGEKIVPFDIELLYYAKNSKFARLGSKRLPFPTADIVVSKMLWSCYFPVDYQFIYFGGAMEKEKIATGIRPLLGRKRVFTYKDVNGYNQVLESWNRPTKSSRVSGKMKRLQNALQSEFRSNVQRDEAVYLNQLKQEIDFARNIRAEQEQGAIAKGGGGVALLKIEVPASGQLYRFAKTLIEGEDLYLDFQYVKGWISTMVVIFLLLLAAYIIYRLRTVIKSGYLRIKAWLAAHREFWDKFKSPEASRLLLVFGAFVFWFISRFVFVVLVLLFLIAWLKPEWLFRSRAKTPEPARLSKKTSASRK